MGWLALGTVDDDNVFHLLPKINGQYRDFDSFRRQAGHRPLSQANRGLKAISVHAETFGNITILPSDLAHVQHEQERMSNVRMTLILVAIPPSGPHIILPVGQIDTRGRVYLKPGLEVKGSYWKSRDRLVMQTSC